MKNADIKKKSKIVRYRYSLTKRRRKLKKQLIQVTSASRISTVRDELIEIEKKLQKSLRDSMAYIENKAVKAIKTNSKYFFSYVKKKA